MKPLSAERAWKVLGTSKLEKMNEQLIFMKLVLQVNVGKNPLWSSSSKPPSSPKHSLLGLQLDTTVYTSDIGLDLSGFSKARSQPKELR